MFQGLTIPELLFSCGLSLLFLTILFRPLELAFPAKPGQRFFRPEWWTDLFFLLGQYIFWSGVVFWLLTHFGDWLSTWIPTGFRTRVASQSWWLQAIEVVLLSDLFVYWGHRLQHRVDWLWRFHAIHHSAEHLDWLAAHREHPVDSVYTIGLINLPAFLLGFPLETLVGLIAFRGIWAVYVHSNVRIRLGPLRALIGSPELHHWHHDRDRDAGNYGNVCPLMDVIFGTYHCPNHEPASFGLREPIPRSYLGQMLYPFRPRRKIQWRQKIPQAAALTSAVILMGGYVWYRANGNQFVSLNTGGQNSGGAASPVGTNHSTFVPGTDRLNFPLETGSTSFPLTVADNILVATNAERRQILISGSKAPAMLFPSPLTATSATGTILITNNTTVLITGTNSAGVIYFVTTNRLIFPGSKSIIMPIQMKQLVSPTNSKALLTNVTQKISSPNSPDQR